MLSSTFSTRLCNLVLYLLPLLEVHAHPVSPINSSFFWSKVPVSTHAQRVTTVKKFPYDIFQSKVTEETWNICKLLHDLSIEQLLK